MQTDINRRCSCRLNKFKWYLNKAATGGDTLWCTRKIISHPQCEAWTLYDRVMMELFTYIFTQYSVIFLQQLCLALAAATVSAATVVLCSAARFVFCCSCFKYNCCVWGLVSFSYLCIWITLCFHKPITLQFNMLVVYLVSFTLFL